LKTFIIYGLLVLAFLFCVKPIEANAVPSDQNIVVIKSWALPPPNNQNGNFPITSTYSGNAIFFADSGSNTIGSLDSSSNTITEWNIPTPNSLPSSIKFDGSTGNVYFIESNANTIGRLAPQTNTITEWLLKESNSSTSSTGNNSLTNDMVRQLNSLDVDPSSGSVYFIESNANTIGRLAPQTNTITEWPIVLNSSTSSTGNNPLTKDNSRYFDSLNVDPSSGSVYFIESNANTIGRLAPQTNTITEWAIRSNSTTLDSIALGFGGSNDIYFADSGSNTIGRLNVNTNTITEWNIPTPNSLPSSIKFDGSTGNVYFIESNANTIGRLVPFSGEFTEWKLQEKPSSIEIDSAGNIHYIDSNGTNIIRMD
jgi:virginiamycin B lyase